MHDWVSWFWQHKWHQHEDWRCHLLVPSAQVSVMLEGLTFAAQSTIVSVWIPTMLHGCKRDSSFNPASLPLLSEHLSRLLGDLLRAVYKPFSQLFSLRLPIFDVWRLPFMNLLNRLQITIYAFQTKMLNVTFKFHSECAVLAVVVFRFTFSIRYLGWLVFRISSPAAYRFFYISSRLSMLSLATARIIRFSYSRHTISGPLLTDAHGRWFPGIVVGQLMTPDRWVSLLRLFSLILRSQGWSRQGFFPGIVRSNVVLLDKSWRLGRVPT